MSKQTLNTIKSWFNTGFKPLQQQFWDTFDSFWHKDEIIPAANIENLEIRFGEKADNDSLTRHIHDLSAHGLDRKAGLGNQNNFLVENTFLQKIRTPAINTDSGMDFNLDQKAKVAAKGFAGKLSFDATTGTLSFSDTPSAQQAATDPAFSDSTFKATQTGDLYTSGILNTAGLILNTNESFHQHIRPAITDTTEDTTLFLSKNSGTLARKQDIPVFSTGNNIKLTGTAPNLVINAISSHSGDIISPTKVTYDELNALIQMKSLVPGKEYMISDFQSTFVYADHRILDNSIREERLYYGSEIYHGPVEPLIVMAITPSKFHSIARSGEYVEDEVVYTTQNLKGGILASTKGTIMRRTDKLLNNTANFDYRRTKFKTNGGEPQDSLFLDSDCSINASGHYGSIMPVIVRYMKNSELYSFNGDIMSSLIDSKLYMYTGRIYSSTVKVYKCYIIGPVFSLQSDFTGIPFSLNYITARIGQVNNSAQDSRVLIYLANKESSTIVVGGNDYETYLQKTDETGVTIGGRISYQWGN